MVARADTNFDTFLDWCENRDTLSPAAQDTVTTVMARLSVLNADCETAHAAASQASDLDLSQTIVTDLRPLGALSSLESLSLDYNETISDLSPLASLHQLKSLSLAGNQVSDLSPLANLTELEYLYASQNQIRDLSPLARLTQLQYLDLNHNQIAEITPLQFYNRLNSLDLSHNQIEDISIFSQLEGDIFILSLGNNSITDISPLTDVPINVLDISSNPITDYSILSALVLNGYPGMTALTIGGEQVTDLDSIVDPLIYDEDWAPKLRLEIVDSDLRNANQLRPLDRLAPRLDELTIRNSQLQDLSPLTRLTALTRLALPDNQVEELTSVASLRNLDGLDLSHNPVSDLSPLATLTQLEGLNLRYTNVTSLEPLRDLPNLHTVVTDGTPLSEQDICLPPVRPAPFSPSPTPIEPPTLPESPSSAVPQPPVARAKQQPSSSPRPRTLPERVPPPITPSRTIPITRCRRPSGSEWRYWLDD